VLAEGGEYARGAGAGDSPRDFGHDPRKRS
jgi:hypothetical protein